MAETGLPEPRIILLCGLPGSGKTTFARQLEASGAALRMAEDDWMVRLYSSEDAHSDEKRDAIKLVQWDLAVQLVRLGMSSVLDWGLWAREERDLYRRLAARDQVAMEIRYLDVPLPELIRRTALRNADLPPATFSITAEELTHWWSFFQPPTDDELF